MQTGSVTTPFGRRPMTLGQISSQMAAKAIKPDAVAHKWQVFQHIREARELIGATDRGLAILQVEPDGFEVIEPAPTTFQATSG